MSQGRSSRALLQVHLTLYGKVLPSTQLGGSSVRCTLRALFIPLTYFSITTCNKPGAEMHIEYNLWPLIPAFCPRPGRSNVNARAKSLLNMSVSILVRLGAKTASHAPSSTWLPLSKPPNYNCMTVHVHACMHLFVSVPSLKKTKNKKTG